MFRIFVSLQYPLEKPREIDNEARILKKAEMKRKFNRNQKRISPWDIQLSSLTSLIKQNKFAVAWVKIFLVTRIFGNKSIFIFGLIACNKQSTSKKEPTNVSEVMWIVYSNIIV